MNIYEKLNKVQEELVATKNQKNDFGNYNYRSCEDILEAIKPLLYKYKLTQIISDNITECSGRVYITASIKLIDIENDKNDDIIVTAHAREADIKKGMDVAQITGAASSYARKYALSGLYAIDDNKDPDAQKPQKESEKETKGIGTKNIQWITWFCKNLEIKSNKDKEEFQKHYKFNARETTEQAFIPIKTKILTDHPESKEWK